MVQEDDGNSMMLNEFRMSVLVLSALVVVLGAVIMVVLMEEQLAVEEAGKVLSVTNSNTIY